MLRGVESRKGSLPKGIGDSGRVDFRLVKNSTCPERDHCRKALVTRFRKLWEPFCLNSVSRKGSLPKGIGDDRFSALSSTLKYCPERDHCRKALVTPLAFMQVFFAIICPERDHCRKALVTHTPLVRLLAEPMASRKGSLPKGIGDLG